MKTKHIFLLSIIVFLFALSYSSLGQVEYFNNWDNDVHYITNYTGWNSVRACPLDRFNNIPSDFGTFAIGLNYSSNCTASHTNKAIHAISQDTSFGILTFTYDWKLVSVAATLFNPLGVQIPATDEFPSTEYITFWLGDGSVNNQDFPAVCEGAAGGGCQDCHMGNLDIYGSGTNGTASIELNLMDGTYNYSITIAGVGFYSCSAFLYQGASDLNPDEFAFEKFGTTKLYAEAYIDNFLVDWSQGVNQTTDFPTGTYCINDTQCLSGYCLRNICAQKGFREECSGSSECISGSCLNNRCTKPSMIELLDASKTEQFGDDTDTNNFISLIIMIGVALILAIVGAMGGHFLAGLVGGILLFVVSGIFFALIGWLSAFILFGIFVVLLIGVILAFMMGGSAS